MAFPICNDSGQILGGGRTTTSTSHPFSGPSITLARDWAAMTVVVVHRFAGAPGTVTTPAGWTVLVNGESSDASDDVTYICYKTWNGVDGTFTSTNSVKSAYLCFGVRETEDLGVQPPEISTVAVGTTTTPDPGLCTPTGGAKDYLWVWIGAWDGEQTNPPASAPTGYTASGIAASSGTGGAVATNCQIAMAWKQANASSENPGTWTISAAPSGWTAYTMAFHPVDPTGRAQRNNMLNGLQPRIVSPAPGSMF